jgi:hypothetical protein
MPLFRDYPQATSIEPTDAFVLDRIGQGTMYVEGLGQGTQARCITYVIDGGGSAISTGVAGDLYLPFAVTLTSATLLADQSGSIAVDIWSDSYGNYPPTVEDTITAGTPPTITTADKSQDTSLTSWSVDIPAGSTLRFNVDSVSTITRVTLALGTA